MNTNKSKKSDLHTKRDLSLTRRSVVKAGWMIPVILAVGLPPGDLFAQGSNTQCNNTGGNSQVVSTQGSSTQGSSQPAQSYNKFRGTSNNPKGDCQPAKYQNRFRGRRNHSW